MRRVLPARRRLTRRGSRVLIPRSDRERGDVVRLLRLAENVLRLHEVVGALREINAPVLTTNVPRALKISQGAGCPIKSNGRMTGRKRG